MNSRFRTIVALGLVLALVGSGALALISGGGDEPAGEATPATEPTPEPAPRPTMEPEVLTAPEAVSEFRRLHRLATKLTRQRDAFFVEKVFTASGPMLERSRARISELVQTQVLDHSTSRVETVRVRKLEPGEITLFSVIHTSPCYVSEGGENVTEDKRVVRNEVLWTMRWEDGAWKLHDAELRGQKESERRRAECKR